MSVDFSKFDELVNQKELNEQINSVQNDDVPVGKYTVQIEKMEIKPTKANDKLMFAVQMKIIDTIDAPRKQNGRWIFFNRVICGNRTTERWNDGIAIKGVITWLEKLLDDDDKIEFKNYSQFANEVLDIYQDICPSIALDITYDPDAFNSVVINEVFDK